MLILGWLVPRFLCLSILEWFIWLLKRCFPHKKNGYFRAPLLLKKWTLIKRKLPSVFSDKSPALGSQRSSLCRKCVNCETRQINLFNLKHLFAFNLNVWMARAHVNTSTCLCKCYKSSVRSHHDNVTLHIGYLRKYFWNSPVLQDNMRS